MSEAEFMSGLPLVRSEGRVSSFQIGNSFIGAGQPILIAGPCAVESAEQITSIAQFLRKQGADGLRGGLFKPRSSPYSFQGLGQAGLEHLAKAKAETGLFTVVEVTSIAQIDQLQDYADVLQIGARNMQNFELLKAVGKGNKPVLLKRGLSATIQEFLQAAEYILSEGNSRVILCERGIRTFETSTRNTLDINAIPLLKKLTHLPVLADPSHGTGRSDLVIPIAKAALAAGADGLIIEVHPDPDSALSDGGQSLNFGEFQELMQDIGKAEPDRQVFKHVSTHLTSPSLEEFKSLTAAGYQYIPVAIELVTDSETPVTAFVKLTEGSGRFLLESVERGEQVGRFSFIGWEPLLTLEATGNTVKVTCRSGQELISQGDPLKLLEQEINNLKVAPQPDLGKFYGGAVGYIGYDYVKQIEDLPDDNLAAIGLPDFGWVIPRYLASFDHVLHKITLIALVEVDLTAARTVYHDALNDLNKIMNRLNSNLRLGSLENQAPDEAVPLNSGMSKQDFVARVERIKEYILAGDAFQVVLSQRIERAYPGDPFFFYRLLRTINPSPYLFYLDYGRFQLAGSSPETLVRLEEGRITLKPIAGTRPRGKTTVEDLKLHNELLKDPKERAEHIMLVDLGRNDLGRVASFGSVTVSDLMSVENYSHVMHIVSTIQGDLLEGLSGADLIRAVFPAGTLSGAPKVRAMEIIAELEPLKREFYGGAVGYLGFNGNLDTCITIRSVLFKDHRAFLQVGAGIVADSLPELEYDETMNKAGALLAALAKAGGKADAGYYR